MIPIFIINKDRLEPLKKLVEFLLRRGYKNITIIDNKSTYTPLLEWYKDCGANVYFNPTEDTGNNSLNQLAYTHNIEPFTSAVKGNYVLTDSDIIPVDEIPNGFIEDMVAICNRYEKHKVGLGLKIDDIPNHFYKKDQVLSIEKPFWDSELHGEKMPLYEAPVDTTFAVYGKFTEATHGDKVDCFRTGGNYIARHAGWYYDFDKLPEDEKHYLKNITIGNGITWSEWSKVDKGL